MARAPTTRPKRRKQVRKEESIRIRATAAQKQALADAAARAGLGLSSWLLAIGLRAAQEGRGIG